MTLVQATLDQTAREALMQEVLDLTAERLGKGRGMGASFDEEQSLLTWEWYGPQSEDRARLAREHLISKGFSGLG